MKNWLPLVFGPGVGHRQRAAVVVALDRLVLELVARPAGADATAFERRLLAVLAVAALDHEAGDDAVEDHVVVEALPGEIDEVLGGLRGAWSYSSTSMSPFSVAIVARVMGKLLPWGGSRVRDRHVVMATGSLG